MADEIGWYSAAPSDDVFGAVFEALGGTRYRRGRRDLLKKARDAKGKSAQKKKHIIWDIDGE